MNYSIDNINDDLGVFSLLETDDSGYMHRQVYAPGDDISDLPADIQNAITALWTPEVMHAYAEYVSAREFL